MPPFVPEHLRIDEPRAAERETHERDRRFIGDRHRADAHRDGEAEEPGRLRIKLNGGHGGHNGIRSILEVLGTGEFVRVKVGIGRPPGGLDSAEYVLERVTRSELDVIEPCVDRAVDALEALIHRGTAAAMNQFNVRERAADD